MSSNTFIEAMESRQLMTAVSAGGVNEISVDDTVGAETATFNRAGTEVWFDIDRTTSVIHIPRIGQEVIVA